MGCVWRPGLCLEILEIRRGATAVEIVRRVDLGDVSTIGGYAPGIFAEVAFDELRFQQRSDCW